MKPITKLLAIEGIPLWVSFYVVFTVIFATGVGVAEILISDDLTSSRIISWSGREIGIAAVAVVALWTKSASTYVALYVAGLFREFSDFMETWVEPGVTTSDLLPIVMFFMIGLTCTLYSIRGVKRANARAG